MAEPKNNYKIKPYRSEEENENRQLYRSKDNICRKWLSICSDINEHGNKVIYEKCLVQAFNLTEFVMDNFIEQIFNNANNQNNLVKIEKPQTDENKKKKEESGTYRFIKEKVVIDFDKQFGYGYSGKTQILERLKYKLPEHINVVRQNRNKYAHGTDTYKHAIRDEVDSYETIVMYMNTLGELLVTMKKMSPEYINPTYEMLKLQVGKAVGYEDKYVASTLVDENEKERIFYGKNSVTQREVCISELVPTKNVVDVFNNNLKELMKVTGNGIVRTEDVLLKNKTCYIVKEKIEGDTLLQYLRKHKQDISIRRDLMYQVEKIVRNIYKFPNINSSLQETDFVVDSQGDLWLSNYEVGKKQLEEAEVIRRYRLILGIEEEITQMPKEALQKPQVEGKAEQVVEEQVVEKQVAEKKSVEKNVVEEQQQKPELSTIVEKEEETESKTAIKTAVMVETESEKPVKTTEDMIQVEIGGNTNNWTKLWGTLGICSGILLILWALSGLLA